MLLVSKYTLLFSYSFFLFLVFVPYVYSPIWSEMILLGKESSRPADDPLSLAEYDQELGEKMTKIHSIN